jgi:hypothetical protein
MALLNSWIRGVACGDTLNTSWAWDKKLVKAEKSARQRLLTGQGKKSNKFEYLNETSRLSRNELQAKRHVELGITKRSTKYPHLHFAVNAERVEAYLEKRSAGSEEQSANSAETPAIDLALD